MEKRALILQHTATEGPGILEVILRERGWRQKIVHLYKGDSIPRHLDTFCLAIIMGGPMSVHDEVVYPFLRKEKTFIRRAVGMGLPLLGICLGAQLIAWAMGAGVYRGAVKEIGWYKARLTAEGGADPFLAHFPADFVAFQWHEDTMYLPDGACHLVTSNRYYNQAFRLGEWTYALQFHLEMTREIIEAWLHESDEEFISSEENGLPDKILSETPLYLDNLNALCRHFFSSLLKKIEEELIPSDQDARQ